MKHLYAALLVTLFALPLGAQEIKPGAGSGFWAVPKDPSKLTMLYRWRREYLETMDREAPSLKGRVGDRVAVPARGGSRSAALRGRTRLFPVDSVVFMPLVYYGRRICHMQWRT